MCGIVGVVAKSAVNQSIYDALTMLQHRGQDAAGIVTCDGTTFNQRKGNGMVRDVFHYRHMKSLQGNMGIGHVRYPTAGSSGPALSQPFYVNSPYGISLAHNGNLTNSDELRESLFRADLRHLNTDSDSEVLLNVFAHELQRLGELTPSSDDVFSAVSEVHKRCRGAYAVVALIAGYGMVAFRDPNGIRPLVIGKKPNKQDGYDYMAASESVALDVQGFELIGDVKPGEAIFVDNNGELHTKQCAEHTQNMPCLFEYVYFARPDSIIDGISVYKSRLRMGETLAAKILKEHPNHDIDVVIPIPDTSRVSAQVIAYELDVKFREGLMKNRYIGRTFIMPGQSTREKSVRQKLNAIELEFRGKNVLLVDDSIVRGTTCKQIIEMARDAGAKKVYFASAAPAVRYPNVYGIDMPSVHELIAYNRTTEEICEKIGADWLIYQDLEDLETCGRGGNSSITKFESSVFNGKYITGDIDAAYLEKIESLRNNSMRETQNKNQDNSDETLVGLYNDNS